MAIETLCAGCGQKLSVADENVGKRARCPACGQIYTVPTESTSTHGSGGESQPSNAWSAAPQASPDPPDGVRYWMRAVDGNEYGPVDQATLERWFREGRVGPGYQLRQSEFGNWQPADIFRPSLHATAPAGSAASNPQAANPYSGNPYQPVDSQQSMYRYPKPDQGGLVLTMALLGIFCCPIFGIVAWVMGHTALNAIHAGQADPRGKTLVQVGYYLGIVSVVLNLLCYGGGFLLQALSAVGMRM